MGGFSTINTYIYNIYIYRWVVYDIAILISISICHSMPLCPQLSEISGASGPLWSSAAWRSSSPHGKSGPQWMDAQLPPVACLPNVFLILKPRFPTVLWWFKSLRTGKWPSYRWFRMIYHVLPTKQMWFSIARTRQSSGVLTIRNSPAPSGVQK